MAAIDFPASPTNGQYFIAPNNVVYQWQAVPGMWVAVGGTAGQADFCVQNSGNITPSTAGAVIGGGFFTVPISGNGGGFFNAATGRFTPPAGRYVIYAFAKFVTNSAAALGYVGIAKNGVLASPQFGMTTGGATFSGASPGQVTLDANGTDYFEFWAFGQSGGGNVIPAGYATFGAFPVFTTLGRAMPPAPVGDFMATNSAQINVGAAVVQAILNNVVTGNTPVAYYNPATGRFTPPAGRWYISFTAGQLGSTAGATLAIAYLRKNGVQMTQAWQVPGQTGWYGDPNVFGVFDTNGTDYFEFFVQGNQASCILTAGSAVAVAFPLGGAVGPQGPPGIAPAGNYWRQLKRVVPTAGQTVIDFAGSDIPSDINDLMFTFDVSPQNNAVGFVLQFFDAVGAIITANYSWAVIMGYHTMTAGTAAQGVGSGGAGFTSGFIVNWSNATRNVSNAVPTGGIRGKGMVINIRDATRYKTAEWSENHMADAGDIVISGFGNGRVNPTAVSGLRFSWGSGGYAAGGAITLWGSP